MIRSPEKAARFVERAALSNFAGEAPSAVVFGGVADDALGPDRLDDPATAIARASISPVS
jgi:hypothetical protein